MRPDTEIVLVILAMAAAAYATKAVGIRLIAAKRIPIVVRAFLRNAPGAVIVAIVAPIIIHGGVALVLGAAVTAAVSVRSRNLLLSVGAGVVTVAALQGLIPVTTT